MKSKQEKIKEAQLAAIQSKLNNEKEQTKKGSNNLKTKRNVDKIIKNTTSQIVQKKWWPQDEQQAGQSDAQDDNKKWRNMEHHGIIFAQEYKPHNIPAYYKGQQLKLNIFQEEALSWWAQALGTDFAEKPHVRKNVLKQLKSLFEDIKIQSLEDINVSNIKAHIVEENQKRKKRDQSSKKAELAERKKFQEYYQFALIDGEIEKIDNCMIEPPGLFRGRGEHPKAGTFKSRIYPQAFTVNCGQNDPIPKCNVPGHCWKAVVHNQDATWLGSYKDDKRNHMKYMFLAANSKFKGKNDMKKYEKARVLKDHIKEIRCHYNDLMKKGELTQKQLATATYLIDFLALRVGNQKGQDEADTVGCCSLRVEHLVFEDPEIEGDEQKKFKITFDFLGKDSMRYFNTVSVSELAYRNLKSFAKDKDPKQDLFHMINAGKLNDFLKKFMGNLSAKVFRTYNASVTLQNELSKQKMTDQVKQVEPKLEYYNQANRQVAILCNHQKTVAKNFDEQVDKLKSSLQSRKQKIEILKLHQDNLKRKNKSESKQQAAEKRAIKASLKLPKTLESVKKSIQQAQKSLIREEKKLQTKQENRNISLLTSRLNYMDPRISIAWCKRVQLPIEKVFTQKMRDKFCWGMDIEPQFKF